MSVSPSTTRSACPPHPWLRQIGVTLLPGQTWPLYATVAAGLQDAFQRLGHDVLDTPQPATDLIISSAAFGQPVSWRHAPMLTARRRYHLDHTPTTVTLVHLTTETLRASLAQLEHALAQDPIVPEDFAYDGLSTEAWRVLVEQGQRGGPMLALLRLIQAQTKCIRIIMIVGDDTAPVAAYHFDLAGAYPYTPFDADHPERFYDDLVLRVVTAVSTDEVTHHEIEPEPIPATQWRTLSSPPAMYRAGRELGERHFFTQMLRISDLVQIPAVSDAIASQYSEGCFATWDPDLGALVATITGSARPVDKGRLTADDLAVITGLRADGLGARVRHVEGLRNQSPSSESVEMREMDLALPTITLGPDWDVVGRVPVVRSKLHGHRGISAYAPSYVEYVPLDPPYYHYLVSCATEAQAHGIRQAFGRSQALHNPADPRQVVFTVLPGHGIVIAEKWVPGTAPLQTIWEYMDAGRITIANHIPQGELEFRPGDDGRHHVWSPLLWEQHYPLPE